MRLHRTRFQPRLAHSAIYRINDMAFRNGSTSKAFSSSEWRTDSMTLNTYSSCETPPAAIRYGLRVYGSGVRPAAISAS